MKIALSVWQDDISSVLDFATTLLVIDLTKDKEMSRRKISVSGHSGPEILSILAEQGIDVLICGALSKPLASMISNSGVQILPFIRGSVSKVLNAYQAGQLDKQEFVLPGYWQGARDNIVKKQKKPKDTISYRNTSRILDG